jgi:hypothetical protein
LSLVRSSTTEDVLRQHALHGLHDGQLGLALDEVAVDLAAEAAGLTAVAHVLLLLELAARQLHLRRVDHDDEVAGVDVRREGRLVLPAQHRRDAAREATQGKVGRVDHPPLALGGSLRRLRDEALRDRRGLDRRRGGVHIWLGTDGDASKRRQKG